MGVEVALETVETAADVSRIVVEYHNETFTGFVTRFCEFMNSLPLPVTIGIGVVMIAFGVGMVVDMVHKLC